MLHVRLRRATTAIAVGLGIAAVPATALTGAYRAAASTTAPTGWVYTAKSGPARTVVSDTAGHWLATFTNNSRTVTVAGPARVFAEPSSTTATVTSKTWVRMLPQPFAGSVDATWLQRELVDASRDVLATAIQYIAQAPDVFNTNGLRIAGDAHYGPLNPDGTRQEGSDFNDYLGVAWTYGTTVDQPEPQQFGSLDCSGFMRMVWGYRTGLGLTISSGTSNLLPRRAYQMYAAAPGVVTIANTGVQSTSLSKLSPGDLVFFDASTDDGTQIDHVGMYLGRDSSGHYRFISSRKKVDGPTLGDVGGVSYVDGSGFYARAFRGARRL